MLANSSKNGTLGSKDVQITTALVVELSLLALIGVLILLGNALVLLAFIKGPRRLRTYTNYFVANLAISDLMVGCLSVPFWVCLELGLTSWSIEKFFIALDILFGTTSILSLTAISLERTFAVKYPARHYNISQGPVIGGIAVTWLFGIALSCVNIFLFDLDPRAATCVIFILGFGLPLLAITVSYTVLFSVAFNLRSADNQNRSLSRDIQIAKTISVIIGLFVICWAPFFTINVIFVFCPTCSSNWELIVSITKFLHYSNSMMNFFVYAARSPDFREAFRSLVLNRCMTKELRERLRSVSFRSTRDRTSSTNLKRYSDNNNDLTTPQEKSLPVFDADERFTMTTTCDESKQPLNYYESPTLGFIYDYDQS